MARLNFKIASYCLPRLQSWFALTASLALVTVFQGFTCHGAPIMYTWSNAHATFYGGQDGAGTMGGACGYGNLYGTGYGLMTTAANKDLFSNGYECGTCYEVRCVKSSYCFPGKSVIVTVTNFCPGGGLGWCNPGNKHLDMSVAAFAKIAQIRGGIVPTQIRRVYCQKQGNIAFGISGNPWFLTIQITNVAGPGNMRVVWIRGDQGQWHRMTHNWGQLWSLPGVVLVGKALSFKLTAARPKWKLTINYAVPKTWGFGGSYKKGQFKFKTRRSALEVQGNLPDRVPQFQGNVQEKRRNVPQWALKLPVMNHPSKEENSPATSEDISKLGVTKVAESSAKQMLDIDSSDSPKSRKASRSQSTLNLEVVNRSDNTGKREAPKTSNSSNGKEVEQVRNALQGIKRVKSLILKAKTLVTTNQ